jgi:hypothetical protein
MRSIGSNAMADSAADAGPIKTIVSAAALLADGKIIGGRPC